jgi:hypothetical protein
MKISGSSATKSEPALFLGRNQNLSFAFTVAKKDICLTIAEMAGVSGNLKNSEKISERWVESADLKRSISYSIELTDTNSPVSPSEKNH